MTRLLSADSLTADRLTPMQHPPHGACTAHAKTKVVLSCCMLQVMETDTGEQQNNDEAANADANEDGGIRGRAVDEQKVPFAFTKCKDVHRKGTSSFTAECLICGKKVNAVCSLLAIYI